MGPAAVRPPWEQAAPSQRPAVSPQVAQEAPRSPAHPAAYPGEGQPLPRPRARRTAYFGPQGQPGEEGEEWPATQWGEQHDIQGAASRARGNPRQGTRPRGEPMIDDVLSPSTRPMFADDDEPANGMNLDSGKGRRR